MTDSANGNTCRTTSWGVALVLGIVAFFLALKWMLWGMVVAAILGIAVFFFLGWLLVTMFCAEEIAALTASTAPAPMPEPEAVPALEPESVAAPESDEMAEPEPMPEAVPVEEPALVAASEPETEAHDVPETEEVSTEEPATVETMVDEPAIVEVVADTAPSSETAPSPEEEGGKPASLEAPRGGKADDLKLIKGVGPALEKQMNEIGIFHFDQIANWNAADIAWIDENMVRFKGRATRDDWVGQAEILAAGGVN